MNFCKKLLCGNECGFCNGVYVAVVLRAWPVRVAMPAKRKGQWS